MKPRDLARYIEAETAFYRDPELHLRRFLTRAADAVKRYQDRGKVKALAERAEQLVADLFPPPSVSARLGEWQVGCGAELPPPPRGRSLAAEAACNALAEELQRVQAHAEGGRKGGQRAAEPLDALRERWERYRAECKSDTAADKQAARGDAYAGLSWQAVEKRRERDEAENGRWARP